MSSLQIGFGKDVIVMLVVTILIGFLLVTIVSYLSEVYFGDVVSSLLGGVGEYDLLLIVEDEKENEAQQRIEQIVKRKLPGSRVIKGIKLIGRVNFFIDLAERYKNRDVFLKLEDHFSEVPGLESSSLITEPRITVRGLERRARSFIESRISSLSGVEFTVPKGDKLEVIIESPGKFSQLRNQIEQILANYQVLSVRFPITARPDELIETADILTNRLKEKFPYFIYNITSAGAGNVEELVTTLKEMKKFLGSYTSQIKVKLQEENKVEAGDQLVVPGKERSQVILEISEVENKTATALVVKGDSRQILGDQVYKAGKQQLKLQVGRIITINNPRQQLAYVVNQLAKIIPTLNSIFNQGQRVLRELIEITLTFKELESVFTQVKVLNQQLSLYQQEAAEIDFFRLKEAVYRLEENLSQLVAVVNRLQFVQELLVKFTTRVEEAHSNLTTTSEALSSYNPYQQEVRRLEQTLNQLVAGLRENTDAVIGFLNRYNPVSRRITSWHNDVKQVKKILEKAENINQVDVDSILAQTTRKNLVNQIQDLNTASVLKDLRGLQEELRNLEQVDFEAVFEEFKYIQQSLPELKDEEITSTIKLIDKYIAGQVIPGEEISLLLPAKGIDEELIKTEIQNFFPQSVSFYSSQVGIISPGFRTQLYQVLSEVKMVLAILTAFIWTIFSLLFDQTLVISFLRSVQGEKRKWYFDLGIYYGVAVGSILLSVIFVLGDINIPDLYFLLVIISGGIMGLFTAFKAESINEVSTEEFQAGKAMGFSYAEILREIVIPAGKPGVLKFLNRHKTYF